ncbi:hypothetical protein ABH930_005759 [Kitasatospora sp. GAS204A]|uniref:condensation domain-containing protein n=1 Tax=unclassified Kitasatospora TaxID=2633591 RepID=UPI0024750DEC|nr:condensation domain-containing protein [Kitasatospora sp. GAS204B]MDH6121214.1 hypothetical protein [Kitasatospora sp. GAS204B]
MGEVTIRQISLGGGRARTAPLAWGQRTTWDDMGRFLPEVKAFFVLSRRVPVPAGLGADAVVDGLRVLLERHESLRSRYHRAPGAAVVQEVLPEGRVPLTVIDWTPADGEPFEAAVERAQQAVVTRRIDHASEPPVLLTLLTRAGAPALVVLGVSHVAADARAVDLLMAELAGLLDATAAGAPAPPPWTRWQPADQAAYEQSPAGMLRNAAALHRLREQLAAAAPGAFPAPVPPVTPPGHPRYLCGRLESAAVPLALRVLARRHRTSTSAVLLAATAALARALTGTERHTFALVAAGRTDPAAQYAITSLSQTGWATLDTGVASFAELTATAATALADTARHCLHDPRAARTLIHDLQRRSAAPLELGCRFNDMWAWTRKQPVHALPDQRAVRAATAGTRLDWPADQATDNDRITLSVNIYGTAERIVIEALADTHRLPRSRLGDLLRGYERLLVELVTREVAPAEVAELLAADLAEQPERPGGRAGEITVPGA